MSVLRGLLVRLRPLLRPRASERELEDELRFHLEMQEEAYVREGMDRAEAKRRSRALFGGVEGHRERAREEGAPEWTRARISWLDVKLGVRMFRKHPGLSLVGTLAIAVGVGLAAAFFEFGEDMFESSAPAAYGGRSLVRVELSDEARGTVEARLLSDFVRWRAEARSVRDLSAAWIARRQVVGEGGRSESLDIVHTTAAAFRLARYAPLVGRPLLPEDEEAGAEAVVVLGEAVWRRLFDADRGVVGRRIEVGNGAATVVGVMPAQFRLPINHHVWMSAPVGQVELARGDGPAVMVFGHLAPGVTASGAAAELTAIAAREPRAPGEGAVVARVIPYAEVFNTPQMRAAIAGLRVLFVLLVAVAAINVATLMFARTASRAGELALRSALGASRRRLMMQLFAEALVLTAVGAALGLLFAWWGLRRGMRVFWEVQEEAGGAPFWWNDALSVGTGAYAALLVIVGAAIIGFVPAWRATGTQLRGRLQVAPAPDTAARVGSLWSGMIVLQVAISVAYLPFAAMEARDALRNRMAGLDFAAGEFATGRVTVESAVRPAELTRAAREAEAPAAAELLATVRRRVAAEPDVLGVAFANRISGMNHGRDLLEYRDLGTGEVRSDVFSRVLGVDGSYLEVMGARLAGGRAWLPEDFDGRHGVIVNETFVREVNGGRSPIGDQIRFPEQREGGDGWSEIVGVVADLEVDLYGPGAQSVIYEPLRQGRAVSLQLFVRTTGAQEQTIARLGRAIESADPRVRLEDFRGLEEVWSAAHRSGRIFAAVLILVAAMAVALSLAGIYALMSFSVARRRREIGIRAALGARPGRILATIFSRAAAQLCAGIGIGSIVAILALRDPATGAEPAIAGVAIFMLVIGLAACAVPARRAIRVQPAEAFRGEG